MSEVNSINCVFCIDLLVFNEYFIIYKQDYIIVHKPSSTRASAALVNTPKNSKSLKFPSITKYKILN